MAFVRLKKGVLFSLGILSLFAGAIGAVLPLLPTTPFLLLAAYFFARSCQPLHDYLANLKGFGPILLDWEHHGVIPLRAKRLASLMMLLFVSYPLLFMGFALPLKLLVGVSICLVLAFIWSRPSLAPSQEFAKDEAYSTTN